MDWNTPPHRGSGPGSFRDLEVLLERLKGHLGFTLPGKTPFWGLVLIVLVVFLAFNSYYTVDPEETAVVQRFGGFERTTDAGLHFKLPFGIETVRKVGTGRVQQREYGYRTGTAAVRSRFVEKGYEEEARMLSGDLNVIDLQWAVQYRIDDPKAFLFRVDDVELTIDDIAESVVRRIVGNRFADEVLTVGRASIAEMARTEMQQILDTYDAGIRLVTVQLQNANPPDPVKAAFNEVNEARQEKERMINEAQKVFNQQIPRASGEARQIISQAEGYGLERINRAQGESRRFVDILNEYQKAPEVSRQRMYLETFQTFVGKLDRLIVIDQQQRNLLPLLDLNRLTEGTLQKAAEKAAGSDLQSGSPASAGDKIR